MLNVRVYAVGKIKKGFYQDALAHYQKLLKSSVKFEWVVLSEGRGGLTVEQARLSEAEALLKRLTPADFLIVLDEHGSEFGSIELSKVFQDWMNRGISQFNFAIGGAFGWHKSVLARANQLLALSKMTLAHELAAVLLTEQLYRVNSILGGGPYHK